MNLKQKLLELKNSRYLAVEAAEQALTDENTEEYDKQMELVKGFNTQIEQVETTLAEKERFAGGGEPGPGVTKGEGESDYDKAVKSFASAARTGFRVTKEAGDMMQSGVDADGGYTIPPDIVTRIIELRDAKESLLSEVRTISVTTPSGRRTIKKRGQHQGFATVKEAGKFGKTATPQFDTISYEIEKRGGYLPVTNELLADSDNNITAVATEWLADEARVTANREILEVIQSKEAQDLGSLDGILKAWIGLGTTFRATSKLITNDDGLVWLATLKDENGRYLLSPNPADPAQLQLCAGPHVLSVKTYDNDTIASDGTKVPMILGDLKEGVAYWDRRQFGVKVSDVAAVGELNAFEQDLTIWRGSLRDDCTTWDDTAFVNGYVDTASAGAAG
jgi:HK97 family phage major capsid protein